MRRLSWQIGGIFVAIAAVVVLAIVALGGGTTPSGGAAHHPSAAARATPTADARVAEVVAAARRYMTALATSMKTGSPDELDSLSVPGSQAEGNAGVSAHVAHNSHLAFVVTGLAFQSVAVDAFRSSATATVDYTMTGYTAAWPSLDRRGEDQQQPGHVVLEFSRVGGAWLVDTVQ